MMYVAWGALFVAGLMVGSFLNVAGLRYSEHDGLKKKKIIGGRSQCSHCKNTLQWFELIPLISFIVQKGKCRTCRARISFQYPIVELLTGTVFSLLPFVVYENLGIGFLRGGGEIPFWFYALIGVWLVAFAIFIFISIVDMRLMIIPDGANIAIAILGIGAILLQKQYDLFGDFKGSFMGHFAGIFGVRESIWINHIAAALFGLLFFGLIVLLSRGKGMGLGDVKLAFVAGILLGWPDIVLALFLSFIAGSLVGIYLLLKKKKNLKQGIPFGPFIVIGIMLAVFFGTHIMKGYFALFPL